jgi:hypothetical protein
MAAIKGLITFKALWVFKPLNAKLNPTCHLLAFLGGATIVDVSGLRVNSGAKEMKMYFHTRIIK